MKRVLIIGRPNVGKSTLYNKFVGKHSAITYGKPGVTRDVLESICLLGSKPFVIMDCAGFDLEVTDSINRVSYAAKSADVVLFVTEHNITEDDKIIANWIRKNITSPVILVINKVDKKTTESYINIMGFKNYIHTSAEHNIGIIELCNIVDEFETLNNDNTDDLWALPQSIKIAILGRPNVGKSTFVNNIIGSERMLVSPIAGTTRDSVDVMFKYDENIFTIVDTAGIRKRTKIYDALETASVKKAFESISKADVVIFMCDIAIAALEKQDLLILNRIIDLGKPFLILANKSDQVEDIKIYLKYLKQQCIKHLAHDTSVLPFSALNGNDPDLIIKQCLYLWKLSNTKIPTSKLNKWLKEVVKAHAHPLLNGSKAINFKYINQISIAPLRFLIHTNFASEITKGYKSYLKNKLARSFNLANVPIFLQFRQSSNPYESKKKHH